MTIPKTTKLTLNTMGESCVFFLRGKNVQLYDYTYVLSFPRLKARTNSCSISAFTFGVFVKGIWTVISGLLTLDASMVD